MDEDTPQLYQGCAGYMAYPDGLLTVTDLKQWRAALREQQRRRRPMGFAPWPEDVGEG